MYMCIEGIHDLYYVYRGYIHAYRGYIHVYREYTRTCIEGTYMYMCIEGTYMYICIHVHVYKGTCIKVHAHTYRRYVHVHICVHERI